jgi:hypothetical protein
MPPKKKPRPPSDEPEAQTLSKQRTTTRAHRPPDPVTPKQPPPDPETSTVPNQDNNRFFDVTELSATSWSQATIVITVNQVVIT